MCEQIDHFIFTAMPCAAFQKGIKLSYGSLDNGQPFHSHSLTGIFCFAKNCFTSPTV